MKRILLILLVLATTVGAFGQRPQRQPQRTQQQQEQTARPQSMTVVFLTTLTCDNCRQRIEGTIPFQRGVSDVVVDVPTKKVTVTYNPNRSDTTRIIAAFKKLGYQAKVLEVK